MSWQRFRDHFLVTPVQVEHTVPPADIVPGFTPADIVELDDTPAARELDPAARLTEALRLVEAALARESERARKTGMRNPDLANLCLEVRSVLREVPPLGVRYPVPVVPGRAS